MAGIFDVQAGELINEVAKGFKQRLKAPSFVPFVKTGAQAERAPQNPDWWFVRTASVLYRVYVDGPVGTESLRTYYGGKKRRKRKPPEFRKASGKIVRTCLQALEKEGLLKKAKKGRLVTADGEKLLAAAAKEVASKVKQKEAEPAVAVASAEKK